MTPFRKKALEIIRDNPGIPSRLTHTEAASFPKGASMEIWKAVPSVADCEASSEGRIRFKGKLKPLSLTGKYARVGRGYLATRIRNKLHKVHLLICEAFHGKKPFASAEVNHKSGITTENKPDKIEWTTRANNQIHAIKIGLKVPVKGEQVGTSVLTECEVRSILSSPLSSRVASSVFGISATQIKRIRRKESWKHVTT